MVSKRRIYEQRASKWVLEKQSQIFFYYFQMLNIPSNVAILNMIHNILGSKIYILVEQSVELTLVHMLVWKHSST
jgi:hypothetical protein